jgi:hypothetical protein
VRFSLLVVVFALLIISTVLIPTVVSGVFDPYVPRHVHHIDGFQPQQDVDFAATAFLSEDYFALPGFSSHLPLVVLDTRGQDIPIHRRWQHHADGHSFMVPIEGMEAEVDSVIYIFDSGGQNSLEDIPTIVSQADVRRRGNTSMTFEKGQYRIRLKTETDQNNSLGLLGMSPHHLWVLRGSTLDGTLMRDYLALTVSAEFMPFTPNIRFVEVFIRDEQGYRYEGVYLLKEHIRQGPDRIALTERTARGETAYIIRRDRYSLTRPILDTYATRNGLTHGFFDVIFPRDEQLTDELLHFIEQDISRIEQILYSDDPEVFLTYVNYINVDSFIDYFLINEFFMNYDAGFHSTYFYRDLGGLLHVGPVWDFDFAVDRYHELPARVHGISFAGGSPWFERLVLHDEFAERLSTRYKELRRTHLSATRIDEMIGEVDSFLHPARLRDWTRWSHIYTNPYYIRAKQDIDPNSIPYLPLSPFESVIGNFNTTLETAGYDPILMRRSNYTYEQEINQIRYALRTHGDAMLLALNMYMHEGVVFTEMQVVSGWIVFAFITAIVVAAVIAERYV